mmetsp:Transcript_35337/g.113596  ORF Transcript_35337/g.113596 Transcript_35337/m.113596 type:complete len:192 (-) Transcript_35337:189-764(-)
MLQRWQRSGPKRKTGPKVCAAFEQEVLDKLVYRAVEDVANPESATIVANVTYSYAAIKLAASQVADEPKWKENPLVNKLKFSKPWTRGWLKRVALRRRRVTASQKVLPSPDEVNKEMSEIQTFLCAGKYTPAEVISADETGVCFGAAPKKQYVPEDAARATAPESDDKARITYLFWGTGSGEMGPYFAIIK